ncbi:hypothetical protein [Tabrizicola sp.]|uniref:hypothetical protein n=1 Tax=Tabrizicola sp. TaxID=2005166 RepID=UPI0025E03B59|nr:hypothetical protein [Tabrizicola sp.]
MSRKKTSAAPRTAAPASAVPGNEAQTIIQDAPQATQPESTLGDGDATGAAQEAPSATAAPQAPAPDVVKPAAKAKAHVLRVTGPAKGRWRAGRKFGAEPVDIPVAELTEDDLAKLEGDPELTVALVPQD